MILALGEPGAAAVAFERYPSDQAAVVGMLRQIRRHIEGGKRDFARFAPWVDRQLAGVQEKDELAELGALLAGVKRAVRFTRDPVKLDTVRAPHLTVARGAGDCDDLSAVLGAAAEHAGYPVRLAVCGPRRGQWKHVYPEAWTRGHGWISMDPSEKDKPLGWRSSLPRGFYQESTGMVIEEQGISGLYSGIFDWLSNPTATSAAPSPPPPQDARQGWGALALLGAAALAVLLLGPRKKKGRRQ